MLAATLTSYSVSGSPAITVLVLETRSTSCVEEEVVRYSIVYEVIIPPNIRQDEGGSQETERSGVPSITIVTTLVGGASGTALVYT